MRAISWLLIAGAMVTLPAAGRGMSSDEGLQMVALIKSLQDSRIRQEAKIDLLMNEVAKLKARITRLESRGNYET